MFDDQRVAIELTFASNGHRNSEFPQEQIWFLKIDLASGKHGVCDGKSPCLMGRLIMTYPYNMAINSELLNCQRVSRACVCVCVCVLVLNEGYIAGSKIMWNAANIYQHFDPYLSLGSLCAKLSLLLNRRRFGGTWVYFAEKGPEIDSAVILPR